MKELDQISIFQDGMQMHPLQSAVTLGFMGTTISARLRRRRKPLSRASGRPQTKPLVPKVT